MTTFSNHAATEIDLHCPQCGYNLRGINSGACPECGMAIDRAAFAESQLPWSHRKRLGYVRAYLRTLGMGLLDSKQLASEIARPVSYRDAQLFRLITVLIAWIPLAALAVWGRSVVLADLQPVLRGGTASLPEWFSLIWPWVVGAIAPGVAPIAIAILLLMLSGVASYYFHPRTVPVPLQNRGIALSYYACAPLVLLPVAVGLIVAAFQVRSLFDARRVSFSVAVSVVIAAFFVPLFALIGWWLTTVRLRRRVVHASGEGSVLLALTLPIAWLICTAFSLFGFVWTVGFFILVVRSLV